MFLVRNVLRCYQFLVVHLQPGTADMSELKCILAWILDRVKCVQSISENPFYDLHNMDTISNPTITVLTG